MNKKSSLFLPLLDHDASISVQTEADWIEQSDMGIYVSGDTGGGFVDPPIRTKRRNFFYGFVVICFLFLAGRIGYLQIIRGVAYREAAEGNRQRIIPIPSERGLIFDRNDVQLTKNIPNFSLALVPQDLPRDTDEKNALILRLSELVEAPFEDVEAIIERYGAYSYESIIIQEDIDYETALRIHIAASDIPGIHIHRGSKRLYIEEQDDVEAALPLSMSHILGYLGKLSPKELKVLYEIGYLPADTLGKIGIEKQYESLLRGTYGVRRIEVNSLGKEQKILAEEPPMAGSHVTLTIDTHMQRALEDVLMNTMKRSGYSRAAAVVMDPRDGAILSMVSIPAFDNNDFSGGIDVETYNSYITDENLPLFNRAIAGTYPSGSTIKPAVAAAALEEGVITPQTTFLSQGGVRVGPWFFPDWQAGGHGRTDVRKSIAWSVNTFYYFIGGGFEDFVGLGVDRIARYLSHFGFSSQLGIDIPGEAIGFIPSKQWKEEKKRERWYVGDTYNLSIGQGDLLATPLQLATYISSIANGGTLYKPRLVEKTTSISTQEERRVSSEVIREIPIRKSHIETVRLGMKDCVDYGSCRRLSLLPFSTAGKTGTAQWSSTKEPHAWFTAFAPYDNPEISVTILVEEGEGGSATGAPITFEFLNWWWKYKNGTLDG